MCPVCLLGSQAHLVFVKGIPLHPMGKGLGVCSTGVLEKLQNFVVGTHFVEKIA